MLRLSEISNQALGKLDGKLAAAIVAAAQEVIDGKLYTDLENIYVEKKGTTHPDEIILDRVPNRHVGFGAGMHRCLGSFLARAMFDIMVSEVLGRMPDYQVVEESIQHYPNIAVINGWIHLPATFMPGRKTGAVIA